MTGMITLQPIFLQDRSIHVYFPQDRGEETERAVISGFSPTAAAAKGKNNNYSIKRYIAARRDGATGINE